MVKFLRRIANRYSKLGKKRTKKQVWRKPKGRDNKLREKRRGYGVVVSIGYKKPDKKERIVVRNLSDLEKGQKGSIILLGRVGRKKKLEILKKAQEKKIEIQNIDIKKFLNTYEEKKK